jgi:cobalt-zinc-cadmium efflux system outer membrane protein
MRAAVFLDRAPGLAAGLVGLAGVALACASPSSIHFRKLADDLEREASGAVPVRDDGAALFAGRTSLERRALVEAVLARNPNLEVARQAWRAALARYPQATGLDDPMLGFGVAPLSFGSSRVDPGPRVDVSQRLPFPGKRRLRGEAALAEAEAAGWDLATLRLELAELASSLFDDAVLAARALEINHEHSALVEDLHRTALARYAAGEDTKQSVLQAELGASRALVERNTLEADARAVAEQMNALLHRPIEASLPAVRTSATGTDALEKRDERDGRDAASEPVAQLVERAVAEHPRLAAAGSREQAALARVDLARREFLPDFTVLGAYDRLWQENALSPYVGVQLNVPLQLGRRRAALDESQAELESTRHRRAALEDEVRLAVSSAVLRLEQAREAERLVRDRLLPAAADQVDAARTAYATGRSSFLVLIDALRELHEIELGHEESLAQIGRRRAALDRALGRVPGLTW